MSWFGYKEGSAQVLMSWLLSFAFSSPRSTDSSDRSAISGESRLRSLLELVRALVRARRADCQIALLELVTKINHIFYI
jgi:hypothetical protein